MPSLRNHWFHCLIVCSSLFLELLCFSSGPSFPILAEDGSSSCVCWANGEQASTFLRLSEKLPETALGSTYGTFKWVGGGNRACGSSGYYLEKILKKHSKITMNNYGSLSDSCEDLSFSVGPENVLSNSDENLLKSVVYNACFGRDWVSQILSSLTFTSQSLLQNQSFTFFFFPFFTVRVLLRNTSLIFFEESCILPLHSVTD